MTFHDSGLAYITFQELKARVPKKGRKYRQYWFSFDHALGRFRIETILTACRRVGKSLQPV